MQKMKNRFITIIVMIICLIISYGGHYYFQRISKDLNDFERSECSGTDWVTIEHAFIDYTLPKQY
jgi:hypothetical protein